MPNRRALSNAGSASPFGFENALPTIYIVGDTHYGAENADLGNPNTRQVDALNTIRGMKHPLGGRVARPGVVVQIGDAVHEDFETTDRFASDYRLDGTGAVRAPCYLIDGNHDRDQVRTHIVSQHGSLTWGFQFAGVWFQAFTENYTAPNNTTPPTSAQIASVASLLAQRPPGERTILLVHRALSGGYEAEWAADALDALEALANSLNTLAIIHGHDHYTHHYTWRGIHVYSPGSVAQFPQFPPYTTTYPEAFIVLRIAPTFFDVADYQFGYDVNRILRPSQWNWAERVYR